MKCVVWSRLGFILRNLIGMLVAGLMRDMVGPATAEVGPDELGVDESIFVKRKPYSSDHYYTDINNGTSKDRFLADNGIYI